MSFTLLSSDQQARVTQAILDKFDRVAVAQDLASEKLFAFPTGREGLEKLAYPADLLVRLPEAALARFCGVGNPFAPGLPAPGERVLDVGCGAGTDALIAALAVGPGGTVLGVDLSPAMLARARENAALAGLENAVFEQAEAGRLPAADESVDLLISSGVYNLVVDKQAALVEAYRVLAPGGRLQVADQIARPASFPAMAPAPFPLEGQAPLDVSSWHH